MVKKIIVNSFFIFILSCGFQPMLKNLNISELNINKVNLLGKNELTYILQSNLNIITTTKTPGYLINISINESLIPVTKNSSGIVTEEDLSLTINLNVQNNERENLFTDSFSETKRMIVTNNLSNDDSLKRNERVKLIQNLAQKIKFKLMIINNSRK